MEVADSLSSQDMVHLVLVPSRSYRDWLVADS